jgi:hypothetical protein
MVLQFEVSSSILCTPSKFFTHECFWITAMLYNLHTQNASTTCLNPGTINIFNLAKVISTPNYAESTTCMWNDLQLVISSNLVTRWEEGRKNNISPFNRTWKTELKWCERVEFWVLLVLSKSTLWSISMGLREPTFNSRSFVAEVPNSSWVSLP